MRSALHSLGAEFCKIGYCTSYAMKKVDEHIRFLVKLKIKRDEAFPLLSQEWLFSQGCCCHLSESTRPMRKT